MAEGPALDFQAFVAAQREVPARGAPDRAYTYSLDRQMRATFESAKPVELAAASAVRVFKQVSRGQLLGSAVKVSQRQFPRIFRLVERCAETLSIATPTVYIVNNPTLNAGTYGTEEESFIVVHSALVDHYSDDELLAVLGHECGHIHNSHVVYLTTLRYLQTIASAFIPWVVYPALLPLNAWSRRAEITCDRAGMLCAKDADVASRALTKLVLGSRKLYEEFDLEAFLEQHEEGKESIGRFMEVFASHPYLPKRVLAMRVFAESAVYREAVGLGDGGLSMAAVDERVKALLSGGA